MTSKFTTLLKRVVRRNSSLLRTRGRVIRNFSKKIGLVTFGNVDQSDDEIGIIRGLTASTTHQDSHFAVGSYDDYDISIVDRFDLTVDHTGTTTEQTWLIMQIDLKRPKTVPHMFLQPINHSHTSYAKFFMAFHHLQSVNAMLMQQHSHEFHTRYNLFAASSHAQEIDALLSPIITNTIAARFWPHAVEILDNKLYIYTTDKHLTTTMLESALESALWLAQVLDQVYED